MFNWMKLGKTDRTKFGRWLDNQGIYQAELENKSKLSRATISKLCNDHTYRPKFSTVVKITRGLKKLGKDVNGDDFWM